MTDLSDKKDVAERNARLKSRQRENDDAFTSLLATKQGRQWLFDFLAVSHIFVTTHRGDALASAFAEGERNVGLRLVADTMRLSPHSFTLMLEENANAR